MSRKLREAAWGLAPAIMLAAAGVAMLRGPAGKAEPGRGRGAASPAEIPARGWKDILKRTVTEFNADQAPLIAAGITFYTLLALFPALGAFVALYGLFADVREAQQHLRLLAFMLPADALKFIGDQMIRLASAKTGGLSVAFAVSLATSIWSANGAVNALMTGLNIAYEETEARNWFLKTLVSLAFAVGFLAFIILGVGVLAAAPAIETFAGPRAAMTFRLVSTTALLAVLWLGLTLLYCYGPSREPARWRWITWGSVSTLVLWIVVSVVFSSYVGRFAHYDRTYGPLGAVIGFMIWSWLSSMVVLAGAELNSEIERQAEGGAQKSAPKPQKLRRAAMAGPA